MAGSYMERLWGDKAVLASGYFTSSFSIFCYLKMLNVFGRVFRKMRRLIVSQPKVGR